MHRISQTRAALPNLRTTITIATIVGLIQLCAHARTGQSAQSNSAFSPLSSAASLHVSQPPVAQSDLMLFVLHMDLQTLTTAMNGAAQSNQAKGIEQQLHLHEVAPIAQVCALIIAAFALIATWRVHAERAMFEMIDRVYATYYTLEGMLLSNWQLSHIFCLRDEYSEIASKIKNNTEDKEKCAFLLKERAMIIHILMIYEQIFYQWYNTNKVFHARRGEYLKVVLDYFCHRLLRNPRILGYVEADTSKSYCIQSHLDEPSWNYLQTNVIGDLQPDWPIDRKGPFA
jgi:hypothetical protein